MVAVLSGLYRHSQRMVKTAMQEIFDIRLSLGTINKLRMEASTAVEKAVEEAKTYIQNAAVVGADETSFSQKNMDGCNSKNSQAWLWTAVTPFVTFFQITLTRCPADWIASQLPTDVDQQTPQTQGKRKKNGDMMCYRGKMRCSSQSGCHVKLWFKG
ncbi:MAG: transposase [Rhizonema sp. NSF051]|nr:transposase [Rhizonema sp. NSF051]